MTSAKTAGQRSPVVSGSIAMNTSAMIASSNRELRELASSTVSLLGRGVKCYRKAGNPPSRAAR